MIYKVHRLTEKNPKKSQAKYIFQGPKKESFKQICEKWYFCVCFNSLAMFFYINILNLIS